MIHDTWYMMHDAWCSLLFNVSSSIMHYAWCVIHDTWCMMHDACIMHDAWYMIHDASCSLLFKKFAGGHILRESGVLDLDWQQRLQHGVNDENSLKEGHRSEISSGFPQIWLVRKIFRVPAALLLPFAAECLFRWLAPDQKKDLGYNMSCESPFAILFF